MIMVWGMVLGMICLNEIVFYSGMHLCALAFAVSICVVGISFLLKKSKQKNE